MEPLTYPTARSMAAVFDHQRDHARKRLIEFLATITREDFVRPFDELGGESIRDVFVRVADTSAFLISLLQNRPHIPLVDAAHPNLESIVPIVDEVADRIHNVLWNADEGWFAREEIFSPAQGRTRRAVPAWVTLQMLAQEHRHAGQIELMARLLGYEPPGAATEFYGYE